MGDEIIIDESNFHEYFFEIAKYKPQKGQVLARYTAMAEFVEGDVKDFVVSALLNNAMGAEMSSQVMKHHCHATDEYASAVPLEIAKDLKDGMTAEEVKKKAYRFQVEYFYWTAPENIPTDDVHWEMITVSKAEMDIAWKEVEADDLDDMEEKEREADEKIQDFS
jgi:hypothetical protein